MQRTGVILKTKKSLKKRDAWSCVSTVSKYCLSIKYLIQNRKLFLSLRKFHEICLYKTIYISIHNSLDI
jgi:hypothetical protein